MEYLCQFQNKQDWDEWPLVLHLISWYLEKRPVFRIILQRIHQIGSEVYLKVNSRKDKFSQNYAGPFVLERLLGERNALIRLGPNKTKIVHTDRLKLAAYPCNDG